MCLSIHRNALRCFQGALLIFVFVCSTTPALAQGGRINGRVVASSDGTPVVGAAITLDLAPGDGKAEKQAKVDAFGFFELRDIPAGTYKFRVEHPHFTPYEETITVAAGAQYQNRVIKLTPIDAQVYFDIYFQVWCLSSQATLSNAGLSAQYWKPDGDLSGPPDAVFNRLAGPVGDISLLGMQDGFYSFTINATGWDPITYTPPPNSGFVTAGNRVRLIRYHYGSVFMHPIKQDLPVTVIGFDPVKNKPAQPLKGITLKLTGTDMLDSTITLGPALNALSSEDGAYTFEKLPPIPYHLTGGHLGYVLSETNILPNGAALFAPQTLLMELEPTAVKVILDSPYQTVKAVKDAKIVLKGIRNSNTEGIDREMTAAADAAGNTASALFENLLPGRYWIRVGHETTITGLPSQSGPLFGPNSFQVSFLPRETYAEVTIKHTNEVTIKLQPVPAKIRGRVFAEDENARVEDDPYNPEPNRVFHLKPAKGIVLKEHKLIKLLQETNNSVTVDTDEGGNYTILIQPGIFGVQIPGMAGYTGHNIEFGDMTANRPSSPGPWPYVDIWPYNTFEGGHHGAGLRLDSNHEYTLDLFLHGHFMHMIGNVQPKGDPFGFLVLTMDRTGNAVQWIDYDYLKDTGAEVVATGPATYRAPLLPGNRYIVKNMQPGTYSVTMNHPSYNSTPYNVTIAPWPEPGFVPSVAPQTPSYFFPGITHSDGRFVINADWKEKGSIKVNESFWVPATKDDPAHYVLSTTTDAQYFRMSGLADRLFTFNPFKGGIPTPSYTIWNKWGDGWFSSAGSGTATFDAYQDGPNENTPPDRPPAEYGTYTLDLHAYSLSDTNVEIPGVVVQFLSGANRTAGGQVAHDGSPYVRGATLAGGQWTFSGQSDTQVIDSSTRFIRTRVYMNRTMVVKGKVTSKNGAVQGAAVVVRNRYGNPVAQGVTSSDGSYNFGFIIPQRIYIDVNRRGYIPFRQSYPPGPIANPDITADIQLQDTPPPTIDNFTMNRFGLFLPGVANSGDATGFNPLNAKDKLTVTWKSESRGSNYTLTLPGYVQANEQAGPAEVFDVVDRVSEVWVVDRRVFTNAFVNELNQESFQAADPPQPLDYIHLQNWLSDIVSGKKNNQPYYVIHQILTRSQNGPGNKFEGKFNLWELPSGLFSPRIIAITEGGGVAIKDYELPPGGVPLQGMNLPQWAATILEAIGLGANFGKFTGDIQGHYGDGFLKIGTVAPTAEARIGLDPLVPQGSKVDPDPAKDSTLTYKFTVGVEMPFGERSLESGPLNLGPSLLGIKIQQAKAELEIKGKERKSSLAIGLASGNTNKVEERNSDYLPVVAKASKEVEFEKKYKYGLKAGITEVLNTNYLGNNTIESFGVFLDAQGTVDGAIKVNLTPYAKRLPYAGPVVILLNEVADVKIKGIFEGTMGAKFKLEVATTLPKPAGSGTTTRGAAPPAWSFMASTKKKTEIKLILRVAAGLQLTAFNDALEGTALFQLGAPADAPSVEGMLFTINTATNDPIITKIEGAFSGVLRAGVNLWTIKYQKQWQWDFARWVVDRQSVPSFELVPVYLTYTVINAGNAPQQKFLGKPDYIVDQFYPAGSLNVTDGAKSMLVFTGTDPATGKMTILASPRSGSGWAAPVTIASAGGVISVVSRENISGGWIAVWSEIDASDVGNPYPLSSIKYSFSDALGTSWSAPKEAASDLQAMFDLKLASAGDKLVLTYFATEEGPMGQNRTLYSMLWDGQKWSAPEVRMPSQALRSYDSAGNGLDTALIVAANGQGQLVGSTFNGRTWTAAKTFATHADKAISMRFDGFDKAVLAWENDQGAISVSAYDSLFQEWALVSVPIPEAFPSDCQILPLTVNGETLYLLAWTTGGNTTAIWYAYLDSKGQIRQDRTQATLSSSGVFKKLQLRPLKGYRAAAVAQYSAGSSDAIREIEIGLSMPGDCDGDGALDADAIALGEVQDCNHNGIPDVCDIRNGTSLDLNHNGIPDECEPAPADDCNRNGISDLYEISLGIGDFNENGILDACEIGVFTKTVSLQPTVRTRFYRATKITVKARVADSVTLEYEGDLEQGDSVVGPWSAVP